MIRFALVALVFAACTKEAPRFEGPLRISLGDCADAAVWTSGPRPSADKRVAGVAPKEPMLGGDIASGFDGTPVGGLTGKEVEAGGVGFGRSGFGPNNGGTGWGTIGTGRYGTIGRGSGTGYGRISNVPTVRIGQPTVSGDLDKAIIRRYIKRNIQKIQYCYEKELLAKPALKGTVDTVFVIQQDGKVATSSGNGFDATVANCVAGVIKGIEFPKPKGGGGVQVNYPFTFTPAGASPEPPPTTQPPVVDKPKPPEIKTYSPYTPGAANPFKASALEECLRTNDKAYGVATIKPGTTMVAGLSESAAKCVGELAAAMPAGKTCSIAFGTMPVAELPAIEVTADAIKFEGAQVADPRKLGEGPVFKIEGLFERVEQAVKRDAAITAPVSIVGPWVVRAADATPIEVISKIATTIRFADGDYVFAVADGAAWRTVPALTLPIPPVPQGTGARWTAGKAATTPSDEAVQLSVLLTKDRTWTGISRVNEFSEVAAGDWSKLEAKLAEHRKSVFFADRYDLEIAGEGVTYADLIKAIEIAYKVGFADVRFANPSALSARPTL